MPQAKVKRRKTAISRAESYEEIAQFWATHDLADYWDRTRPVKMKAEIRREKSYFPVEKSLSSKIISVARRRGVSTERLVNAWLREKLRHDAV